MEKPDYIDEEQLYKKLSKLENDLLYLGKRVQVLEENRYLTPTQKAIEKKWWMFWR